MLTLAQSLVRLGWCHSLGQTPAPVSMAQGRALSLWRGGPRGTNDHPTFWMWMPRSPWEPRFHSAGSPRGEGQGPACHPERSRAAVGRSQATTPAGPRERPGDRQLSAQAALDHPQGHSMTLTFRGSWQLSSSRGATNSLIGKEKSGGH